MNTDFLKTRMQHILNSRPLPEKKKYTIPKVSEKRKAKLAEQTMREKELKEANKKILPYEDLDGAKQEKTILTLDDWFDIKMKTSNPICMECGMQAAWVLEEKYHTIWKASQAHILPKKKGLFPSLATNLDNHLILFPSWGGHLCGCHGFFDSNWYNATTMRVWPKVEQIFLEKLYPVMDKSEHRHIPEPLQELLKQKGIK